MCFWISGRRQTIVVFFPTVIEKSAPATNHATAERGLDLGSLGGTTHLLLVTEDAELIRRRGRWLAQRTMEVYLQEITATVFFRRMASGTKAKILQLALSFPALLTSMMQFSKLGISRRWYTLLEKGTDGNEGPTR